MYAKLRDETINGQVYSVVDAVTLDTEETVYCGDGIAVGDVFVSGAFLPGNLVRAGRPARTKADAVADKITQIEELARTKRVAIAGDDSSKLDTYTIKYEVATLALAGNQQAITLLTPEATARGETVQELASLVVQLGNQWRYVALMIDAAYQTHKAAVLALSTIEEVDTYDYSLNWPV